MKSWRVAVLSFMVACFMALPARATIAYTTHQCSGHTDSSATSTPCGSAMTVTTGNVVMCVGSTDTSGGDLALTFTATGVTFTEITAAHVNDPTVENNIRMAWGNVTSGGSITPAVAYTSSQFTYLSCAEFSGVSVSSPTDGGAATFDDTGSAATNGVTSGNFTTASDGDLIFGGTRDTSVSSTTYTAGTSPVTMTKITLGGTGGCEVGLLIQCIEWGVQTTHSSTTAAKWTYAAAHSNLTNGAALKAPASGSAPRLTLLGVGI